MAEAPQAEPVPSSSEAEEAPPEAKPEEQDEPLAKRRKVSEADANKLEHRLGGILCCAVCLDLPPAAVYQCTNGHLMCAACFTHLLADARLRDEAATCPNCRVEISKTSASRNLAVEKTVSELPSECKFCTQVFPRHSLLHHEEKLCEEREYKFSQLVVCGGEAPLWYGLVRIVTEWYSVVVSALRRTYLVSDTLGAPGTRRARYRRLTGCRYAVIGCPWRGPAHEAAGHEAACTHPHKSGADVVCALLERETRAAEAMKLNSLVVDLLSYEKITFNDLQLKPYRTEEFVHKLYYESSRFSAFGHQWVVKAFINKHQRDPTQSSQRELTYQLILKSKPVSPLALQWVALRGPYGEARLSARVSSHTYREEAADCPPVPLPLADRADTNRLLSHKAIHFRLMMFL